MRVFITAIVLLFTTLTLPLRAGDGFCGVRNFSFQAGEVITFKVFYTLANVFVGAGEAVFNNTIEHLNGKTVYHLVGEGKTYGFYDKFYKVRDRYESFVDTSTLEPYKFIRNINEGGYKKYENITFNKTANTAITTDGVYKVPGCVQDVVSSMLHARCVDYSHLQPNDKIPFDMFLDNTVYSIYIRYLGRETVRTKYGKFRAIKIKPLLVKGTIFEGGERMTVWLSDDANHIPLRVESPISVGSVKVDMILYRNLRFPMSSLVDL
jgi:hypothetical protein